MLDFLNERVYPLSEFTRELAATRNIERSQNTLRTWIRDGRPMPNGDWIRLEGIVIGGVLHTSLEAFDRFVKAQNGGG